MKLTSKGNREKCGDLGYILKYRVFLFNLSEIWSFDVFHKKTIPRDRRSTSGQKKKSDTHFQTAPHNELKRGGKNPISNVYLGGCTIIPLRLKSMFFEKKNFKKTLILALVKR